MTPIRFLSHACRVLGSLCCLLVGACTSGPSPIGKPASLGPFEIVTERSRVSAPGPDMNPFGTRLAYTFVLKHQGRALAFGAAPGRDGEKARPPSKVLELAYFLPARQAVLVATEGRTFLVTHVQGQAVVTPVAEREFSAYQWLDAEGGQPGAKRYAPADASEEPRTLVGGSLLLLSTAGNKIGVLDVNTLALHTLKATEYNGMDHYTGEYRDEGGPNGKARALSPSRTQFVMLATRYVDDQARKALVVIDFMRNTHAIVPLDVDGTRLNTFRKLTPEWLARNYAWVPATDGREQLVVKRPGKPVPWTGYLTDRATESPQYRLQPVTPAMQELFIAEMEKAHGAVRRPPKPGELGVTLLIGPDALDLRYYAAGQILTVEPALGGYTESAIAACQALGAEFDRQLAAGAHQGLFTHLSAHDIWAEH